MRRSKARGGRNDHQALMDGFHVFPIAFDRWLRLGARAGWGIVALCAALVGCAHLEGLCAIRDNRIF
jgi:hypothetical protein